MNFDFNSCRHRLANHLLFRMRTSPYRSSLTFGDFARLIMVAVVGLLSSFTAYGQEYPIRLDPHEKPGRSYQLAAWSNEKTTVDVRAADQAPQQSEDLLAAEISADVIILEAFGGWATRKQFKVLSSTLTRAGTSRSILPYGTQVMASIKNGQTVYEVDHKLVDDETARALRGLIGLHIVSVANDDLFGTPTPKRIGEKWTVGVEAMKKLLKEIGVEGGNPEITGSSTLEKAEKDHVFLRGSIRVRNVLLPAKPELTTETGEIETELWGRFPILEGDMTVESNDRIRLARIASGLNPNGKKMTVQIVYERTSRYEIRPTWRIYNAVKTKR
jgi:hypothetical protein